MYAQHSAERNILISAGIAILFGFGNIGIEGILIVQDEKGICSRMIATTSK